MSEDDYGLDEDFFEEVQKSVKGVILEKQLLKPGEKQEIINNYKKHIAEQMKIENSRARELFIDKYGGTVCLIRTPEKIYKKNKAGKFLTVVNDKGERVKILLNKPERCANKSLRLWGFNLPLFSKTNKNTMFGETMKSLIGYNQKALVRGAMTKKYKYSKKAMFESAFIKFMKDIYEETKPDRNVETIEDIDYEDYYDDFTFNIWETLHLWGDKNNV